MSKKIRSIYIFLLILGITCLGCADKRPKYKNLEFEFFLHYNPTWEMKERVDSAVVAFLAPQADKLDFFQETMTITIDDLLKPVTLAQYTEAVQAQVKAMGTMKDVTLNVIETKPLKISGKAGHQIVYNLTQYGNPQELVDQGLAPRIDAQGETIQIRLAWTIRENRVYLFTYVAQRDSYATFITDVDAMIQSFRFL